MSMYISPLDRALAEQRYEQEQRERRAQEETLRQRETPAARAAREEVERREASKLAATARVEAQRAAEEQAKREADVQCRAEERARLEAEVREAFFASPAATEEDWERRKEVLVDAEHDRRGEAMRGETRFVQAAFVAEHL